MSMNMSQEKLTFMQQMAQLRIRLELEHEEVPLKLTVASDIWHSLEQLCRHGADTSRGVLGFKVMGMPIERDRYFMDGWWCEHYVTHTLLHLAGGDTIKIPNPGGMRI